MHEVYWSYEDMIIQVENFIDCLKTLNGEQYKYLFIFDHSNGHDRVSPDALNPTAISKYHGGSQPFMRDSRIADASYLGPHEHETKLKIGDIQTMTFSHADIGPFYLTEKEKEQKRFDKIMGGSKRKILTRDQLISKLKEA